MSDLNFDVEACLAMQELPSYDFVFSLAKKVCSVLSAESDLYRPKNCVGEPGALLELNKDLPAIIIPDIHARPDFVRNILNCEITIQKTKLLVKEALKQKLVNVICVGDAVHTELYSARWKLISLEFEALCISTFVSTILLK